MGADCGKMSEAQVYSKEIEKEILRLNKRSVESVRLLLLGPGESGKSTIFKQMKILQEDGGFSLDEQKGYKSLVYRNCVSEMKALCAGARKMSVKCSSPQLDQYATWFADSVPIDGSVWSPDVAKTIAMLWADPYLKEACARRGTNFHLNDTAAYFFDNVLRFAEDAYVPTNDDILRTRIRSTGIEEAQFKFADMEFKMMDVGGQRSERRKWIHCFEHNITAVVFCASLASYDQVIREDDETNAMTETLSLFEEVTQSSFFSGVSIILLLNKKDLFEEKIKTVDLKVWNQNYSGGLNFDKASEFIKARFTERVPAGTKLFAHMTIAIDSKNVDYVFKAIRKTLMDNAIDTFL